MENFLKQLESLCEGTKNNISMLSNASALLNEQLQDINWVGFYLIDKDKLILGPFQGKVACIEIAIGKGVCGTAYQKKMLLNVDNVHEFPGHIACDSRSNSEIVIPLQYEGKCFGVLDIDSTSFSRFSYDDEIILEKAASIISKYIAQNIKKDLD